MALQHEMAWDGGGGGSVVWIAAVLLTAVCLAEASEGVRGGAQSSQALSHDGDGAGAGARQESSSSLHEGVLFTDSVQFSSADLAHAKEASDTLSADEQQDGQRRWGVGSTGTAEGDADEGQRSGEHGLAFKAANLTGTASSKAGEMRKLVKTPPPISRSLEDEAALVNAQLQQEIDEQLEQEALGPVQNISMVGLVVDMGVVTQQQLIDGVHIPTIVWQRHLQQQRLLARHRRLFPPLNTGVQSLRKKIHSFGAGGTMSSNKTGGLSEGGEQVEGVGNAKSHTIAMIVMTAGL